ncbi:MAG: metallophosphoesterase family protein [Fimbriimonadales bacterium]
MLTTFLVAATAFQGPFQPINHIPLPPDRDDFTFVALGDNRPAGSGQPPTDVFKRILTEVAWIHPAFVLSTGDLIYGNEESIEQYRKECAWIKPLVAGVGVPFFNAPGNHEINARAEFQSEYTKQFGAMYGSFDYGGCRFIGLATDQADSTAKFTPAELSWLDTALADKKPAFIFQHRPYFARKPDPSDAATVDSAPAIAAKFAPANVKAVFEGHDHVFNHTTHGGVEYYIAGGAGAPLDAAPEEGGFFHYLLVHVRNGKVEDITVMPLGSIDVRQNGSDIRVSSYVDADVDLGNVVVTWPTQPTSVHAAYDKKGKMADTDAAIVAVEKGDGGFRVHLSLSLKKHRQTIVHLG